MQLVESVTYISLLLGNRATNLLEGCEEFGGGNLPVSIKRVHLPERSTKVANGR